MKMLVVSNLYPPHYIGGYELRCQCIVDDLRTRGHEIHVLTPITAFLPARPLRAETAWSALCAYTVSSVIRGSASRSFGNWNSTTTALFVPQWLG